MQYIKKPLKRFTIPIRTTIINATTLLNVKQTSILLVSTTLVRLGFNYICDKCNNE